MATSSSAILLIVMTFVVMGSEAGNMGMYWGQIRYELSLAETCDRGNFAYVSIAFLSTFGNFQTPKFKVDHCYPATDSCTSLTSDIEHCQAKGIKVMLSLGGDSLTYSLVSTEDAKQVASYLWNNYLGGSSSSRPFGSAVLDGIDFHIKEGGGDYWDDLAKFLSAYNTDESDQKKVYLSAAPQCPFPDSHLKKALDTGVFDYVWIQFYENPQCEYFYPEDSIIGDITPLINAWKKWSDWASSLPGNMIFLGLPASDDATRDKGFITVLDLKNDVLPKVKESTKYGGVMLWDEYHDELEDGYSDDIKNNV